MLRDGFAAGFSGENAASADLVNPAAEPAVAGLFYPGFSIPCSLWGT